MISMSSSMRMRRIQRVTALFGSALLLTFFLISLPRTMSARTESADATINLTPEADTYVAAGRPSENFAAVSYTHLTLPTSDLV